MDAPEVARTAERGVTLTISAGRGRALPPPETGPARTGGAGEAAVRRPAPALTGRNPKLDIAVELEKRALDDDYFVERKLYPNVDFYSGLIYEALNLPPDMFTVMFAIPRTSGWVAQWGEMQRDPETKIARPRRWTPAHASATTRTSQTATGRPRRRARRTASPHRWTPRRGGPGAPDPSRR